MEGIVYVIALVIAGPMVGVEFAVAAFTNPIFGRLPDDAYWQARRDGSRVLGRVMPFWYIATLVALIAVAVVSGQWLVTAAAVLMAAVVLTTVTVLVPINNRIGAWTGAADVDRGLAHRWDRLHWIRVALLAFVFLMVSAR